MAFKHDIFPVHVLSSLNISHFCPHLLFHLDCYFPKKSKRVQEEFTVTLNRYSFTRVTWRSKFVCAVFRCLPALVASVLLRREDTQTQTEHRLQIAKRKNAHWPLLSSLCSNTHTHTHTEACTNARTHALSPSPDRVLRLSMRHE